MNLSFKILITTYFFFFLTGFHFSYLILCVGFAFCTGKKHKLFHLKVDHYITPLNVSITM